MDVADIGWSGLFGVANAVVSVAFAVFLIPLAERVTGVTSHLTLIEYSDLNRPLLERLSVEAPGTYAHTIAMANLVEAACNAVGANGLLGRVGCVLPRHRQAEETAVLRREPGGRPQSARQAEAAHERADHQGAHP